MGLSNLRNIYPSPTWSANAAAPGQALTATSTAAVQFTVAFAAPTEMVVLDIQLANVWCTFDGTTPASGAAHVLTQGLAYTWNVQTAKQAKFIATTTTNAVIYASQFQT